MTDAREIITSVCFDREVADLQSTAIMNRLTDAGFRILGPDEVEDVRRIVEIANRNEWSAEGDRLARAIGRKA